MLILVESTEEVTVWSSKSQTHTQQQWRKCICFSRIGANIPLQCFWVLFFFFFAPLLSPALPVYSLKDAMLSSFYFQSCSNFVLLPRMQFSKNIFKLPTGPVYFHTECGYRTAKKWPFHICRSRYFFPQDSQYKQSTNHYGGTDICLPLTTVADNTHYLCLSTPSTVCKWDAN